LPIPRTVQCSHTLTERYFTCGRLLKLGGGNDAEQTEGGQEICTRGRYMWIRNWTRRMAGTVCLHLTVCSVPQRHFIGLKVLLRNNAVQPCT